MTSPSTRFGWLGARTSTRALLVAHAVFRRGPQRWLRRLAPHLPPTVHHRAAGAKRWMVAKVDPEGRQFPSDFVAVFDADWYSRSVGGLRGTRAAIEHYLLTGWRRGIDPSPLFSVRWYLAHHRDVVPEAADPLSYYLDTGWRLGHDPSPHFSSEWYLEQVPDEEREQCPLVHYLTVGARAALSVSPAHAALIAGERPTITPEVGDEFAVLTSPDGTCEVPVPMLADLPVDLVTFDLWDTLVRRTRPADAAKVATARRLWLRLGAPATPSVWDLYNDRVKVEALLAAGSEREDYEAHDVLTRVVANGGTVVGAPEELVDALVSAETADERAGTVVNQPVADLVDRFEQGPDQATVMVLSDFYLGSAELTSILEEHHIDVPAARVLSSCEIGASKRLGTAYLTARQRSGLDRPRHLHIGDHAVVDGERAVDAGATSAVVRTVRDGMPAPGELSTRSYDELPRRLSEMSLTLHRASGSAARMSLIERHAHGAGAHMAVLAVSHVAAALEVATYHGVSAVHYLSREGAFLAAVHDVVGDVLLDRGAPRPVHVAVSRRSTFAPSLHDLDSPSMARMWRQYAHQSMRGMLVSLGVDADEFAGDLDACGLDLDSVLSDVAQSASVRSFLARSSVRDTVLGMAAQQRALLQEYLADHGFGPEVAVIADLGWRGTIQDNICLIRPDCSVHGVYLGLFPFLNPQPANATKTALVFDGNGGEPFGHVDPPAVIEAPMTPLIPSPIAYRRTAHGVAGVMQPEHDRAEHLVEAFQAGLLTAAPAVAEQLVQWGATSCLMRHGLQSFVESLYTHPPDGLADIWFESAHDDTFGVLNETPYEKAFTPSSVLSATVPVEQQPAAVASRWPPGYASWLPIRALDLLGRIVRGDLR